MAWYTLRAETLRPYSERPTSTSGWATAISNATGISVFNSGGVYEAVITENLFTHEDEVTCYNISSRSGYIAFGSNENNTSFEIFFVATCPNTCMGPFLFSLGSGISRGADYGGYSNSIGRFGVWKVGTLSASSRAETFKLADFNCFALRNDPNAGLDSTDSYQTTGVMRTWLVANPSTVRFDGAEYEGCVDITASITLPGNTVTMGKSVVAASATISNSNKLVSPKVYFTTFDGVTLASGTSSVSYNAVLPYTLEQYLTDAELRRTTKAQIIVNHSSSSTNNSTNTLAPIVFLNGKWQPFSNQYVFNSADFVLQIDSTRLPTFTSIAGEKISNHNSQYVMLMNGYDKITFAATVKDQSYAYRNDYTNYVPTFALYCGDVNLGNYKPASVSSSGNTLTTTYNGTWGPITVNPPVALGTNQTFRAVYQDRFGRQAETNISLKYNSTTLAYQRFYNYVNPTFGITGQRVNSSGTPDDRNGTYIKITYNWAASLLDYSMSPHTGTIQPKLKITNNQDSTTNNYTLTTASGSNSFTLSSKPLDKSYTFTAELTDAAGRTYVQTCFVASGSVFMDFLAGGSGLGIGKRAEAADKLSIGWATEIAQALNVSGNITGPTITDIYDKINKAGGGSISLTIPAHTSTGTTSLTLPGLAVYTNVNNWYCVRFPLIGSNYTFMIAAYSYSGTNTFSVTLPYTRIQSYPSWVFAPQMSPSVSFSSNTQISIATGSNNTKSGWVAVGYFVDKNSNDVITTTGSTTVTAPAQTVTGTFGSGGSGGGDVTGGLTREEVQQMIDQALSGYTDGNNMRY